MPAMPQEEFDKLVEEKRAAAAQNIWDKFLSPEVVMALITKQ